MLNHSITVDLEGNIHTEEHLFCYCQGCVTFFYMETLKGCEGFHRRVRIRVRKSGPLLKPLTLVKGKGFEG